MKKVKYFVKVTISYIYYITGIFRIIEKIKGHPILTYHNVINNKHYDNSLHLGVSHSSLVFEKHLDVLTKYFDKKNLFLTFDDGYRNNLENAVPILDSFFLKGLFFVPLIKNRKDKPFWIDRLMFFFSYAPIGNYKLVEYDFFLDDKNRISTFSFFYHIIMSDYALKNKITEEVDAYIEKLNIKINKEYWDSRFSFLDSNDYDELIRNKHKLGFHTINHDICSKLTKEYIKSELEEVKIMLKKYNINSFSFPFGGQNEINLDVLDLLKENKLTSIYSNTNNKLHKDVKPRVSIPNITNKYLIIASYLQVF